MHAQGLSLLVAILGLESDGKKGPGYVRLKKPKKAPRCMHARGLLLHLAILGLKSDSTRTLRVMVHTQTLVWYRLSSHVLVLAHAQNCKVALNLYRSSTICDEKSQMYFQEFREIYFPAAATKYFIGYLQWKFNIPFYCINMSYSAQKAILLH